jgi:hypothetical protein
VIQTRSQLIDKLLHGETRNRRVAKLARYLNLTVALFDAKNTGHRVTLWIMKRNLCYAPLPWIIRYLSRNILTVCLICRITESWGEIIISKTANSQTHNPHDESSALSISSLLSVFSDLGYWHSRGLYTNWITVWLFRNYKSWIISELWLKGKLNFKLKCQLLAAIINGLRRVLV